MGVAVPKGRVETWFVIPRVRNSDKRCHVALLWGYLREEQVTKYTYFPTSVTC